MQTPTLEWREQVFVMCSESYRTRQLKALAGRLHRATASLLALTPAPGRGKRQFQDETALVKAAQTILQKEEDSFPVDGAKNGFSHG